MPTTIWHTIPFLMVLNTERVHKLYWERTQAMSYSYLLLFIVTVHFWVKCVYDKAFHRNQNRNNVRVNFMSNAQPKTWRRIDKTRHIQKHTYFISMTHTQTRTHTYAKLNIELTIRLTLFCSNKHTSTQNAWIKMNEGVGKVYRLSQKRIAYM